jgi:hypothetical protein
VDRDASRYADGCNIGWELVGYGREDERRLPTSFPITRDQLLRLRDMFDRGDDEWMAACYEVKPAMWPRIVEVLRCPPPGDGVVYFVEGFATDR